VSTINTYKEAAAGAQPVYLFDFTWADGSTLAVSAWALTYAGTDYLPRVDQQQIDPIQALSPHGIEIPGSVRLTLADADKDLYAIEAAKGFRGARLKVTFLFRDFVVGAWSSDAVAPFVGRCDRPEVRDDALVVTASNILNLEAKLLPVFPIQVRCPKLFPATSAAKAVADTKGSPYYACGVTNGAKTSCTYDKAGCAANANSPRFGGVTWEVPAASRSREYVSGSWLTDLRSDGNAAKYGDYAPIGYGTAWVDCLVLGSWPEANSTRGEAIVCEGRPGRILKVVVDDEELPPATDLDGNAYIVADRLFRYNVISSGDRTGAWNPDAPWNGNGDPHGSLCVIEWVVYHKLTAKMPRVRALIEFPKVRAYAKIDSVSGGVVTLANNAPNVDIAGNSPFTIRIVGNSNGALNATWGLASWTAGPPGTVTLSGTAADGTGGYIEYEGASDKYAWAMLDVLLRSGLTAADLDLDSWIDANLKHTRAVSYTARDGTSQSHAKYTCSAVVRQRRPAADLLTGMLRGCTSHLGRNLATGGIALFARGTLAEQQPAPVNGSNYNTSIGGGYVAYHFAEGSMVRDKSQLTRPGRASGSVPNVATVSFGNEENDYSGDSVVVKDIEDVNLMGQEIAGNFAVEGCNALDRANRVAAIFLAEQLGGETWRWTSSVKGVRLAVGQIVAVSNAKHGHTLQLMRLQQVAPAPNHETCTYDATVHDDAWYGDSYQAVTGNPATAARRNRLVRPSWPWQPYKAQPASGDPVYPRTEWTFGLQLRYEAARNGGVAPVATVTGVLPVNEPANLQPPVLAKQGTTASSGGSLAGSGRVYFVAVASKDANGRPGPVSAPCVVVVAQGGTTNTITAAVSYWDPAGSGYYVFVGRSANTLGAENDAGYSGTPSSVTVADLPAATWGPPDTEFDRLTVRPKYVWHAGVFGAAVTAVGTRTLTIAGAGWTTNQWAGYTCTVLAKADLSALPVLNFRVASNTGTVLTIDGGSPDPNALGVAAGDVLVMLSQPSVSGPTLTDANWVNTLSNGGAGLTAHQEQGRVLRIIAGAGRGYRYRIADNTSTAITVADGWVVTPDSTSRYVIEDATVLAESAETGEIKNADQTAGIGLALAVRNYAGATLLLEAATADGGGDEPAPHLNPVRLLYVPGAEGTVELAADATMRITDGTVIYDTSGASGGSTTLGAAITDTTSQDVTLAAASGLVDGQCIQVGSEVLRILSGAGTTALKCERGAKGSTAATHSNGATVTYGGVLTYTCLAASAAPDKEIIVRKKSTDLNGVKILRGGSDTWPGGGSAIYLWDESAGEGTARIKFPGV
jgi:hypothetical protein